MSTKNQNKLPEIRQTRKIHSTFSLNGCGNMSKQWSLKNVNIYIDEDSEKAYIEIDGNVECRIVLKPSCVEGGGGNLYVDEKF